MTTLNKPGTKIAMLLTTLHPRLLLPLSFLSSSGQLLVFDGLGLKLWGYIRPAIPCTSPQQILSTLPSKYSGPDHFPSIHSYHTGPSHHDRLWTLHHFAALPLASTLAL